MTITCLVTQPEIYAVAAVLSSSVSAVQLSADKRASNTVSKKPIFFQVVANNLLGGHLAGLTNKAAACIASFTQKGSKVVSVRPDKVMTDFSENTYGR